MKSKWVGRLVSFLLSARVKAVCGARKDSSSRGEVLTQNSQLDSVALAEALAI